MKKEMQATGLRSMLIVMVVLTLGAASAGFYFAFGWIKSYADEVNVVVLAAVESGQTAGSVSGLQQQLEAQQAIITTANSLFAVSATYQTQVIKDIYAYAAKSDISVSDIALGEAAPAAEGSTGSSLPTQSVTVSLESPVSYTGLLRFLTYIETSTPKMQISGVDLSRPSDGNPDSTQISSLTIQVYVR